VERRDGAYYEVAYSAPIADDIAPPDRCGPDRLWCGTIEIHPVSISYGGHTSGVPHDRSIQFKYSEKRFQRTSLGLERIFFPNARLLTDVDVQVQGQVVRSYRLKHSDTTGATPTLLTSVFDCAPTKAGSPTCKRPTQFAYQPVVGLQPEVHSRELDDGSRSHQFSHRDLVVIKANRRWITYKWGPSNGGEPSSSPFTFNRQDTGRGKSWSSDEADFFYPPGNAYRPVLFKQWRTITGAEENDTFGDYVDPYIPGEWRTRTVTTGLRPRVTFVDLDGDGRADLLGKRDGKWAWSRNIGTETLAFAQPQLFPERPKGTKQVYYAPRLAALDRPEWRSVPIPEAPDPAGDAWPRSGSGDFNGDGLQDLIVDEHICLRTASGECVWSWVPQLRHSKTMVLDYTGDGMDDILVLRRGEIPSGTLRQGLLRSLSGESFSYEATPELTEFFEDFWDVWIYSPPKFEDVDGDGARDLVWIKGNRLKWQLAGDRRTQQLLSEVREGGGLIHRATYRGSGDAASWDQYLRPARSGPWPLAAEESAPTVVVGYTLAASHGGRDEDQQYQHFKYEGGQRSLARGEGLGFSRITRTTTEPRQAIPVRTDVLDFDNAYTEQARFDDRGNVPIHPFAGRVKRHVVTRFESATRISAPYAITTETTNTWTVRSSASRRPFVTLSAQTLVEKHDIGRSGASSEARRVERTFDVDEWGVQTSALETVTALGKVVEQTRVTVTPRPADATKWLFGLPELITESKPREGKSRAVRLTYDDRGLLKTVTRGPNAGPACRRTTLERDSRSNVERVTVEACNNRDAQGGSPARVSTIGYDTRGLFPTYIGSESLGYTGTRFLFDERTGRPARVTDAEGENRTTYEFDPFGRIARIETPSGVEQTSYESGTTERGDWINVRSNLKTVHLGAAGQRVEVDTDAFGRTTRTVHYGVRGQRVIEELEYHPSGALAVRSRPHLPGDRTQGLVRYERNESGRVTRAVNADGSSEEWFGAPRDSVLDTYQAYLDDDAVSLFGVSDELGRVTYSAVDHRGRVRKATDPLGRETAYAYSPWGWLERVTAGSYERKEARDDYGRVVSVADSNAGASTITPNAFDEPVSISTGLGQTTFSYDDLGRTTRKSDADGVTSWEYDFTTSCGGSWQQGLGRLVRAVSPDGTESCYGYSDDRLERIVQKVSGEEFSAQFAYAQGLVTQVTQSAPGTDSVAVAYGYDAYGNALSAYDPRTPATPYWKLADTYQGYLPALEELGNARTERTEYEPLTGRLRSRAVVGTDISTSYTYYENGNVHTRRSTSDGLLTYGYDAADRLTSTTQAGEVTRYDYDDHGNLTFRSGVGTLHYGEAEAGPHALNRTDDGLAYGYNAVGELRDRSGPEVPGGTQQYTFTQFGLPRSVSLGSGGKLDFLYNSEGVRTRKIQETAGERAEVTYGPTGHERRVSGGTTEHRFPIYAGGRQVAQLTRSGAQTSTLYVHQDAIGSVIGATRQDGRAAFLRTFTPFGETEQLQSFELVSRGFGGHEFDAELGLINARGRILDPKVGRFLSPDPLFTSVFKREDLNGYSYAWNNPLRIVDPSGWQDFDSDSGQLELSPEDSRSLSSAPFSPYYQTTFWAPANAAAYPDYIEAAVGDLQLPEPLMFDFSCGDNCLTKLTHRNAPGVPQGQALLGNYEYHNYELELQERQFGNAVVPLIPFFGPLTQITARDASYAQIAGGIFFLGLDGVTFGGGSLALRIGTRVLSGTAEGLRLADVAVDLSRVERAAAGAAESAGGGRTIELFHGSIDNFTSIANNGLDPARVPTWVTTDLEAARNAIGPDRVLSVGQGVDTGVVRSVVSQEVFEALQASGAISAYRMWPGFGGGATFGEYVLRHPDAIKLFNTGIMP
jgi:RHS repeat-associated protein